MLTQKPKVLKEEYKEAIIIIGGDFNDAPDDSLDRWPPRTAVQSGFKPTSHLSDLFLLTDAWRFMNPDTKDYTWTNLNRSLQSRIDLWLLSSQGLQFLADISHCYAPMSDHKMITIRLKGSKDKSNIRGY